MNIADFTDYLRQLDPGVSYSIDTVHGGVVNVTIRAIKNPSDTSKGRFLGHTTLILKFAPPYIARIGESAPFSQHRQTIEARALSLFTSSTSSSTGSPVLANIPKSTDTVVPELLHYDPDVHVLVLSDLGAYPDLSHLFYSLGGYHPSLEPTVKHDEFAVIFGQNNGNDLEALMTYFQDIGTRVGSFFARLHHSDTRSRISDQQEAFDNPNARTLVLEHVIKPAAKNIEDYLVPQGRDRDAAICRTAMVEDAQRSLPEAETSFTLGDCWTSAILVSLPAATGRQIPSSTMTVGVIDWEFAGFGRGVHGDMAQLMAHLEMLRISASQHPKFAAQLRALNQLVDALTSSYASGSDNRMSEKEEEEMDTMLGTVKMRSALLACGTEMVCCAGWKKWVCVMPECRAHDDKSDQSPTDPRDCLLIREILEDGIRLILLACEDLTSFRTASNKLRIEKAGRLKWRKDQKWLVDLF